MSKKFIPQKTYKKIIQNIPLCCVDVILANNNKFLLVKRSQRPAKGKWWFPGGRLLFNESLKSGVKRKLKEELDIKKVKSIKFLDIGETKFKKGYFNSPVHSLNITYLVKINNSQEKNIKLDRVSHSAYQWLEKIPSQIDPYLKKFLKLAGFK